MEQTGFLVTGHEKVNQLISNAIWGLKSNFLDMPTDCPQRDGGLGWTGELKCLRLRLLFLWIQSFLSEIFLGYENDQLLREEPLHIFSQYNWRNGRIFCLGRCATLFGYPFYGIW
jgi:hypothetical protein